jgi:hypothetical protein
MVNDLLQEKESLLTIFTVHGTAMLSHATAVKIRILNSSTKVLIPH